MNYFDRVKKQFINFIFLALCGGTIYGIVHLSLGELSHHTFSIAGIVGISIFFILIAPYFFPSLFDYK